MKNNRGNYNDNKNNSKPAKSGKSKPDSDKYQSLIDEIVNLLQQNNSVDKTRKKWLINPVLLAGNPKDLRQ